MPEKVGVRYKVYSWALLHIFSIIIKSSLDILGNTSIFKYCSVAVIWNILNGKSLLTFPYYVERVLNSQALTQIQTIKYYS